MPCPAHICALAADTPEHQVMTGHAHGVITLNIAEADDAERVKRRVALHEPYRTLIVNSLNRSPGHDDPYPFALSPATLEKLRFVHDVIARNKQPNAKDAKFFI